MIVVPNSVISYANKEKFETMAQIITVISDTNGKKGNDIRHSLKNLCFYPPESTAINPLIDLLLHDLDLKEPSKYFKLLCMNLIAHSSLANASPSVTSLLTKISTKLLDLSKPKNYHHHAYLLYRVMFNFILNLPHCINILVTTLSALFTFDLKSLKTVKKKSIMGTKEIKTPIPELINEVFDLLPELIYLDNAVEQIFAEQKVIDGFVKQFDNVSERVQQSAIHFLNKIPNVPEGLLAIINPEKQQLLSRINCIGYVATHQDQFEPLINDLLTKSPNPSMRYLQFLLAEKYGNSPELISSISKNLSSNEISHSQILPLLICLENSPKFDLDEKVFHHLFNICEKERTTLAFISFLCIIYLSDEFDWMKGYACQYLSQCNQEVRKSLIKLAMKSWNSSMKFDDHIPQLRALFMQVVESFGDSLDSSILVGMLDKIIEKGFSSDFISYAKIVIDKIPMTETVVYLLLCAKRIIDQKNVDPDVLAEFQASAKNYVIHSGPILNHVYEIVFPDTNSNA